MQKLNLISIPICIGLALLFFSWYLSYPISIDSLYDFEYNHISFLYWLSLPILFTSFLIVAIKTKNNTYRWLMTIGTILIMYSTSYFHYMIPGSDSHYLTGLTENYIKSGSTSKPFHKYYQWPLFFILNKISILIMGLDLRYFQFILYCVIGIIISSFIYLYASNVIDNGYFAVVAFFIILFWFFNYQWAPFSLSFIFFLLLLYLEKFSEKNEVILTILIIFYAMTYTHIIVPVYLLLYYFSMYILNKNKKYLNLFILTLIIYITVQSYNIMFSSYVKDMTRFHFLEFQRKIQITLSGSVAPQPNIDVIAQFFSRSIVIITTIITGIGFIILLIRRELRKTDYSILLAGIIISPTLLISFKVYPSIFWRTAPLICIPLSLGASYIAESKYKKHFKPFFLILLVLFPFVMIHKTFQDRQIANLTKEKYHCANFMINNINYNNSNSLFSHYKLMTYFRAHTRGNVIFGHDYFYLGNFLQYINKYKYVVYTVGLGKRLLRVNPSLIKSYTEYEIYHSNLIYSSGDFCHIFHNARD